MSSTKLRGARLPLCFLVHTSGRGWPPTALSAEVQAAGAPWEPRSALAVGCSPFLSYLLSPRSRRGHGPGAAMNSPFDQNPSRHVTPSVSKASPYHLVLTETVKNQQQTTHFYSLFLLIFLNKSFGHSMQFPGQGLNPGHSGESTES